MKVLYKTLLLLVAKTKPILVLLFPINFLRSVKKKFVKLIPDIYYRQTIPFSRKTFPDGINLIGQIKNEVGLGQSNRLLAEVLDRTTYPLSICNCEPFTISSRNDTSWDSRISNTFPYNINIFHINPFELPFAILNIGIDKFDQKYNIAFWLWELEEFPDEWVKTSRFLNEIWTPAEFVSESIRKKISLPVLTIPYHISIPVTNEKYNRKYFSLPSDKKLFLCMFDSLSNIQRKNPFGSIKAFKKAFSSQQDDVGLVIKINNTLKEDLVSIKKALKGYEHIYIIDRTLSKVELNSLIKCCDVFVSLHRAEGFGLVLAEAMLLQVPTIATNWSANTEFMSNETACMVDFDFITLKEDSGTYKAGNRWAEPDIDHAAMYMQRLYKDNAFYDKIKNSAFEYAINKFSETNAVSKINTRIEQIYCENE